VSPLHNQSNGAHDRTLTANIRERRGSLVDIKVPIFVDKNTVLPEGTSAPQSNGHVGKSLQTSQPLSLIF
jgi:hypothetical protein